PVAKKNHFPKPIVNDYEQSVYAARLGTSRSRFWQDMTNSADQLPETARIVSTLRAAADAARPYTLGNFRTQLAVDNKLASGFDPVTAADRDAETAIRAVIAEAFPDHEIIGEEWDAKRTGSPFAWI